MNFKVLLPFLCLLLGACSQASQEAQEPCEGTLSMGAEFAFSFYGRPSIRHPTDMILEVKSGEVLPSTSAEGVYYTPSPRLGELLRWNIEEIFPHCQHLPLTGEVAVDVNSNLIEQIAE